MLVLAVSVAFGAALTAENAWPGLGVRPGTTISVELLLLLFGLAVCLEFRAIIGRAAIWLLSSFVFLPGRIVRV